MKLTKFLLAGAIAVTGLTSCSDDDDFNGDNTPQGTADLYATSHTDGNVTKYDLVIGGDPIVYTTESSDSEGIYYDPSDDSFTQASRSSNSLETFVDVSTMDGLSLDVTAEFSSSAALESPRDIAVNGNIYVVADNADVDGDDTTADGRLFIFTKSDSGFTLRNTVTTDFKVWGIEFVGNDLYAVVDTTNQLAVYTNFAANNTTDAVVSADKTIAVEGIVRTHGLDYDGGTMVLTDIGDAGSDSDGALHVITNFDSKFDATADGETLAATSQNRIEGATTFLGNPVNVVYSADFDVIYVAELANNGGRVLSFENASNLTGNVSPGTVDLEGVSSLYLYTSNTRIE